MVHSSSKGHDGLSLNDHLEKGQNYINSLPNVPSAWHWDEFAYAGDIRKMFNQVLVHSVTSQLRTSLRMPSTSWRKLPKWSSLRRRRNFRSERMLMIFVDLDQPLLKPSMSQLQLTKCLERVTINRDNQANR